MLLQQRTRVPEQVLGGEGVRTASNNSLHCGGISLQSQQQRTRVPEQVLGGERSTLSKPVEATSVRKTFDSIAAAHPGANTGTWRRGSTHCNQQYLCIAGTFPYKRSSAPGSQNRYLEERQRGSTSTTPTATSTPGGEGARQAADRQPTGHMNAGRQKTGQMNAGRRQTGKEMMRQAECLKGQERRRVG